MKDNSMFEIILMVIIVIKLITISLLIVERKLSRERLIKKNVAYYHPQTGDLIIRECKE